MSGARHPSPSLLALDPHLDFTGLEAWLDVHEAWPAAHGAVLGVGLSLAAPRIDRKLIRLSAEGARDERRATPRGSGHPWLLADPRR